MTNRILKRFDLQIHRREALPPPLYKDPSTASSRIVEGHRAAFVGKVADCVIYNGFSFGPDGWHPFVDGVSEYLRGEASTYDESVLKRFHTVWQPPDGRAALIGAPNGPAILADYPPYVIHAPWLRQAPDRRLEAISDIIAEENAHLGVPGMTIREGYGLQGPVSQRKGELEYARLIELQRSIRVGGYDRSHGDITVQILRRGAQTRFRIVHGHHRMGVLAALGYSALTLVPTMVIDVEEVNRWQQVREGAWSVDEALEYFHHHFDFDSRGWASHRGLL